MAHADAMVSSRVPLEVKDPAYRALEQAGCTISRLVNAALAFAARHEHDPETLRACIETLEGDEERVRDARIARAESLRAAIVTPELLEATLDLKVAPGSFDNGRLAAEKERDCCERYLREA